MKDISKWVEIPPKIVRNGWDAPTNTEIAVSKKYNSIISHWSGQMMLWYLFLPRWGCNEKNHTYDPKHQQTFSDKSKQFGFQLLSSPLQMLIFVHIFYPCSKRHSPFSLLSTVTHGHTYQRPKTPCAHWYGGWTKSKSPAPKNSWKKKAEVLFLWVTQMVLVTPSS